MVATDTGMAFFSAAVAVPSAFSGVFWLQAIKISPNPNTTSPGFKNFRQNMRPPSRFQFIEKQSDIHPKSRV
jgi:uncharacterized membrane protein YfbV (UPF0208 family)